MSSLWCEVCRPSEGAQPRCCQVLWSDNFELTRENLSLPSFCANSCRETGNFGSRPGMRSGLSHMQVKSFVRSADACESGVRTSLPFSISRTVSKRESVVMLRCDARREFTCGSVSRATAHKRVTCRVLGYTWAILVLSVRVGSVICGGSRDANHCALSYMSAVELCCSNCGLDDEMCGSSFGEVYYVLRLASAASLLCLTCGLDGGRCGDS